MREEIVSYNTAKLARKKGFKERTRYYYDESEDLCSAKEMINWNESPALISAPSQSVLQRWVRENYHYFLTVELAYNNWSRYAASIRKPFKEDEAILAVDGMTIFGTYEEALEEGLEEVLDMLDNSKCGGCDFTDVKNILCPQCKEFQNEIVQNNLRGAEAYERILKKNKEEGNG